MLETLDREEEERLAAAGEEMEDEEVCPKPEQLLYNKVQQFRGGLVLKVHGLLYHSTRGLRVTNKEEPEPRNLVEDNQLNPTTETQNPVNPTNPVHPRPYNPWTLYTPKNENQTPDPDSQTSIPNPQPSCRTGERRRWSGNSWRRIDYINHINPEPI